MPGRRHPFLQHKWKKVPKNTKKYVNTRINQSMEDGTHFVNLNFTNQTATMQAVDLSAIPQGLEEEDRVSDKVKLRSLSVGLYCQANNSATVGAVRIMIISTRKAGVPVVGDLLQDGTETDAMISRRALPVGNRPKILYDKVINVTTSVTAELRVEFRQIFLRKNLGIIEFDNIGATTAPRMKIWLCSIGMVTTNPSSLQFKSVLKYKD